MSNENNLIISKQGYLFKQGGWIKTWKKRYFVLIDDVLAYFDDKPTAVNSQYALSSSKGYLQTRGAQISIIDDKVYDRENTIGVTPAGSRRTYILTADSRSTLEEWIASLLESGAAYAPNSKTLAESEAANRLPVSIFSSQEGYLWKLGGFVKNWKRRYFILEQGSLHYYKGSDPDSIASPLRSIDISGATVAMLPLQECIAIQSSLPYGSVVGNACNGFRLVTSPASTITTTSMVSGLVGGISTHGGRSFVFLAQNEPTALKWVEAVKKAVAEAAVDYDGNDDEDNDTHSPKDVVTTSRGNPSTPSTAPLVSSNGGLVSNNANTATHNAVSGKTKRKARELSSECTVLYVLCLELVCQGYQLDDTNVEKLLFALLKKTNTTLNNIKYDNLSTDMADVTSLYQQLVSQLIVLGISSPTSLLSLNTSPSLVQVNVNNVVNTLLNIPPFVSSTGVTSGWMLREQEGEWRLRWVVINRSTRTLRYWNSPMDMRSQHKPLKTVLLLDCEWGLSEDKCPIASAITDSHTNTNTHALNSDIHAHETSFCIVPARSFGATQDCTPGNVNKKLKPLVFSVWNVSLRDRWLDSVNKASKDGVFMDELASYNVKTPVGSLASQLPSQSRPTINGVPVINTMPERSPRRSTERRRSKVIREEPEVAVEKKTEKVDKKSTNPFDDDDDDDDAFFSNIGVSKTSANPSSSKTQPQTQSQSKSQSQTIATPEDTQTDTNQEANKLIKEWRKSCGGEIIALLISLHVIFPSAPVFKELQDELDRGLGNSNIDPSFVKRCYQQALKFVHPDKMGDVKSGERLLSELVFGEIQTAYNNYKK